MVDDVKIIKGSLNGSQQAFGMLVDKYKSFVCSLAYCATGNFHISEDIAQDVFISVWQDLPSLKDYDKFKSWLSSITRNAVQSYIRKQSTLPKNSHLDVELIDAGSVTNDPSQTTIKDEETAMLWETLENLPIEYRETLVLYYRYDKSTKQVAELLGIAPEAVRQRLSRGRDMLREKIEQQLETGLRKTMPGKKFTASVIATVSALPVGVAVSEAALSTAAATGGASILSLSVAKIAAILIVAAAITSGVILTRNATKPEPIAPIAQPSPVETQHLASHPTSIADSAATATPEPPTIAPAPDTVETHGSASLPTTANPTDALSTFTPRGVLSGLITDIKTGEPVIDAEVMLQSPNYYGSAMTDENGFYYFDTLKSYGQYSVSVKSDEYVGLNYVYGNRLSLNIVKGARAIQHIQLEKACMLEVEAVDEDGLPIENTRVLVTDTTSADIRQRSVNPYKIETNKDGTLLIGGIKPSKNPYMVTFIPEKRERIFSNHFRYVNNAAPTYKTIVLNNTDIIESIKVVIKNGITINGRLLYSDGQPATNLEITAEPDWWRCNHVIYRSPVNENGTFTINHIEPGVYNIRIRAESDNSFSHINHTSTEYLAEDKFLEIVFPLEKPDNLSNFKGKLIIQGNCDIERAYFFMRKKGESTSGNSYYQTVSFEKNSKEAYFEIIDVPAGEYTVDFGSNKSERAFANVAVPSEINEFTLECKKIVTVRGAVIVYETQKPATEFTVYYKAINLRVASYGQTNPVTYYSVADDGRFEKELVDGIHQFIISSEGYAPCKIEIDTSKTTSFTAQLTKGEKLSGKILNINGEPVSDVRIIPFSINGSSAKNGSIEEKVFFSEKGSVKSNAKGEFIIENLAIGSETLKFSHPDYPEKLLDIELPDMEYKVVTLDDGAAVEGYVYDNSGKPRSSFPLFISIAPWNMIDDSYRIKTTTDNDGYYKFTNLSANTFYVRHPDMSSIDGCCNSRVVSTAGETTQLDLGGTYFLTGRIILNGSHLVNSNIAVVDSVSDKNYTNNSSTLSDGSFIFSGIPEGSKKLIFKASNTYDTWVDIAEFDTKGVELDLGEIYANTTDIEVVIKGLENVEMSMCRLSKVSENHIDYGRELTPSLKGIVNVSYLKPGKYLLSIYRKPDNARFRYELNVPSQDSVYKTEIQLPNMTSTIYGKAPTDKFVCEKEDGQFIAGINPDKDGTYKIDNMPDGDYIIKDGKSGLSFLSFKVGKNQTLELNLTP